MVKLYKDVPRVWVWFFKKKDDFARHQHDILVLCSLDRVIVVPESSAKRKRYGLLKPLTMH